MAKGNNYHRGAAKQSGQLSFQGEGPMPTVTVRCRPENQEAIRDVARALKDRWISRDDVDAFLSCGGPGYFAPVKLSSVETYARVVAAADSMGMEMNAVWEQALSAWLDAGREPEGGARQSQHAGGATEQFNIRIRPQHREIMRSVAERVKHEPGFAARLAEFLETTVAPPPAPSAEDVFALLLNFERGIAALRKAGVTDNG